MQKPARARRLVFSYRKIHVDEDATGDESVVVSALFYLTLFSLTHAKNKEEWKSRIIYQVAFVEYLGLYS